MNTNFIGRILQEIKITKKIPDQLTFECFDNKTKEIKSHTHLVSSYTYYKKLVKILAMLVTGITVDFGTKTKTNLKTSPLIIKELLDLYDVNPDLLIYK